MIETKVKILDTAERLIAENGYAGTSLRQIISEAGVNLAAIHYHFGSKEELLDELIERRAAPVNAERIERFTRLESGPSGAPAVESLLEAFLLPMAATADLHPQFVRLMGRVMTEGMMQRIVQKHFHIVTGRFFSGLRRALPELSERELQWRIHFMIGAMAHTMCGHPDITGVAEAGGGFQERIERLIVFLAGGFRMKEK